MIYMPFIKERMNIIKFNFMKTTILIRCTLCAAVLIAFSLVGCEEVEIYKIDAPADLQARIDSIAAAKEGNAGDTTFIDIATAIVGAEDYSSPWWTDFSDYFAVPSGRMLTLEFINYNGGTEDIYKNWVLLVTNEVGERGVEGYAEYFALRADPFGWGNGDFDDDLISHNYPTVDDIVVSSEFLSIMDGAYVTLQIDHSATGFVFITATAVGTDDTELVMTYNQPVSATEDITVFLVAEGSYLQMKKAYLLPSQVTAVEDVEPTSIDVTGAPDFVELGNENFWGDAIATVTFADGSSAQVDSADLSFTVVPDMATLGEKTVVVVYSKTKQGKFTQAVSTLYKLGVTNPVSSLEVTTLPDITTYYFFDSDPIKFNAKGMVVTATYSDGTTGVLANNTLQFGTIQATEGAQAIDVTYEGATSTVTTTVPLTLIKGISQVSATDFSTPWWTEFSDNYTVASGSSKTITLYCYSNNLEFYHSPSTILRKADGTEYAVVRMDNFGWGDGYATATAASDWDFDVFASNISGSKVVITVTNNGDDTADVHYDVTYADGETHFQEYTGITVDGADLNFALVTEGAYLVIVE